jgi:hypothetical protein
VFDLYRLVMCYIDIIVHFNEDLFVMDIEINEHVKIAFALNEMLLSLDVKPIDTYMCVVTWTKKKKKQ